MFSYCHSHGPYCGTLNPGNHYIKANKVIRESARDFIWDFMNRPVCIEILLALQTFNSKAFAFRGIAEMCIRV